MQSWDLLITTQLKTALMLILHGSPRVESSTPAAELLKLIQANHLYDFAMLAFMECNNPSIPEAIRICADNRMQRVIAVPYMLHTGRHLVLDVPALLLQGKKMHPDLEILMANPVGAYSSTTAALAFRAGEAASIDEADT